MEELPAMETSSLVHGSQQLGSLGTMFENLLELVILRSIEGKVFKPAKPNQAHIKYDHLIHFNTKDSKIVTFVGRHFDRTSRAQCIIHIILMFRAGLTQLRCMVL